MTDVMQQHAHSIDGPIEECLVRPYHQTLFRSSAGRWGVWLAIAAAILPGLDSTAFAQNRGTALLNRLEQQMLDNEIDRRLQNSRGQTFGEQLTLDYGASLRFGWAKLDNANYEPYGLRQYEANVYLQATAAGGHKAFGNLRFLYSQYYNSDNDNNGLLDPLGNRYWYQFDL
ncbi:MAG: hypothetical protein HN811_08165, partial [Phycisphaerae bacterium]|nr:hypothetical protein [Phycisphaerae bacterium]